MPLESTRAAITGDEATGAEAIGDEAAGTEAMGAEAIGAKAIGAVRSSGIMPTGRGQDRGSDGASDLLATSANGRGPVGAMRGAESRSDGATGRVVPPRYRSAVRLSMPRKQISGRASRSAGLIASQAWNSVRTLAVMLAILWRKASSKRK